MPTAAEIRVVHQVVASLGAKLWAIHVDIKHADLCRLTERVYCWILLVMGACIVAYPVLVYNVGYNVQLAILLPVVDDHNPANLDVALERHCFGGSLLPSECKVPKDPAAA